MKKKAAKEGVLMSILNQNSLVLQQMQSLKAHIKAKLRKMLQQLGKQGK